MKIFFLDDDKTRHAEFMKMTVGHAVVCTWNVSDAKIALATGPHFDLALLDHDLGGQQMCQPSKDTGHEVAKFIASMPNPPRKVIVHSLNFPASARMVHLLLDAGIPARHNPWGSFTILPDDV